MIELEGIQREPEQEKRVIFNDTDVLSSFMCVNSFKTVLDVFAHKRYKMVVPLVVLDELRATSRIKQLFATPIEAEIRKGTIYTEDIMLGTEEFDTYMEFKNQQGLGDGESAALSLAIHTPSAAIASNNLRDVKKAVEDYHLELWTVPDIIHYAKEHNIITENRASGLWKKMVQHGRRLPYSTYEEYLLKL